MLGWLLTFTLMLVTDYIWARYTDEVVAKHTHRASLYAVAIIFCGAGTTIMYVEDHWRIIPAAIGAYLGTYLAVRLKR
jgi:hypothetical protein